MKANDEMDDSIFIECAQSEIDYIHSLNKCIKKLSKYLDDIEFQLKGIVNQISYGNSDLRMDFVSILASSQLKCRKQLSKAYSEMRKAQSFAWSKQMGNTMMDNQCKTTKNSEIDFWISGEMLYAKMPLLLPCIDISLSISSSRKQSQLSNRSFYEEDLRVLISEAYYQSPQLFEQLENKTITYLFAYKRNDVMSDPDNHDTKSSTDTICSYLPYGDMANHCSISYVCKCIEEIESATYIVVSNGMESPVHSAEIIQEIKKRYK